MSDQTYVFPKWTNQVRVVAAVAGAVLPAYVAVLLAYGGSPEGLDVGYEPEQPVPFSHAVHAGELGMDCRYCHASAELASHSEIPSTQSCMGCHSAIHSNSPKLELVRESYVTGEPVEWVRIHDLPGYSYFNHAAHVNRGVGCVTCHGRVDQMEVVYQHAPLSMGWCIDCHRRPEQYLRPVEEVTNMRYQPDPDQLTVGLRLKEEYKIRSAQYLTSCSVCHH